jgi:hypothetical protein
LRDKDYGTFGAASQGLPKIKERSLVFSRENIFPPGKILKKDEFLKKTENF